MMMTAMITKQKTALANVQKLAGEIIEGMGSEDELTRTLAVAQGIVSLSDAMTDDAVAVLMSLQGNELGFKTDKDKDGGYPADVVKGVAIRAILHGAKLTGNEFNIISRGLYLAQAFFVRRLKEFPGLTDLVIDVDAPEESGLKGKNQWYKIGGYASCKINGKLVEVFCRNHPKYGDSRIVVKAYDNDTAVDGAMGKAKKRIAQKLYERISGVTLSDDDSESSVTVIEPERVTHQPDDSKAWATEFKTHGVMTQAKLILEAPTREDAAGVLRVAKQQVGESIDQRAYDCLDRYFIHKWPE